MAFAALQTFISAAESDEDVDQETDNEAGDVCFAKLIYIKRTAILSVCLGDFCTI